MTPSVFVAEGRLMSLVTWFVKFGLCEDPRTTAATYREAHSPLRKHCKGVNDYYSGKHVFFLQKGPWLDKPPLSIEAINICWKPLGWWWWPPRPIWGIQWASPPPQQQPQQWPATPPQPPSSPHILCFLIVLFLQPGPPHLLHESPGHAVPPLAHHHLQHCCCLPAHGAWL